MITAKIASCCDDGWQFYCPSSTIIVYFLIAQLFHFSPLFALIFTQIYPSFLKQVSVDPSKFKMVCVMLDLGYKYKKRVKKEMNKFEILALSSSEPRYSE